MLSVAFSPDGKRIASGSADKSVRLWDADRGESVGDPMTGNTKAVLSVAFSPDGTRIASGGEDDTVRLWDAHTGQPFGQPLTDRQYNVRSVVFSPDGKRIASGGDDGTVHVWPGYADAAAVCAKLTANMSHQQWRDWVSPDIGYDEVCPGLPVPDDG